MSLQSMTVVLPGPDLDLGFQAVGLEETVVEVAGCGWGLVTDMSSITSVN